jgi:hypothetical protein
MSRGTTVWKTSLVAVAFVAAVAVKWSHADFRVADGSTTQQPSSAPAESKPGGTRPTTPAPEPARPEESTPRRDAPDALPPAPAEKTAPPINAK